MDSFMKMLTTQSTLLIYLLIGVICRKTNIFSDAFRSKLSDFIISVTLPCMILESFNMEFSVEILQRCGTVLAISLCMAVITMTMAKLMYKSYPHERRCIMQYGTIVNNAAFAGFPIIASMYGGEGLLLASIYIIPNRIMMWTVGVGYYTGKSTDKKKQLLRVLTTPAVVAVYIGLVRMILQLPLPGFFDSAMNTMGSCTAPLAMAMVGAILADAKLSTVLDVKALPLLLMRQGVIPLLCLSGLKLLGIDPLTTCVCVVTLAMPVASTASILADKYGADAQFAAKCVFLSTVSSLITVPLMMFLL